MSTAVGKKKFLFLGGPVDKTHMECSGALLELVGDGEVLSMYRRRRIYLEGSAIEFYTPESVDRSDSLEMFKSLFDEFVGGA